MKLQLFLLFLVISLSATSQGIWTQKTDFPGDARHSASGFSIGTKGYIICGNVSTASSDYGKEFWAYNLSTNTWTQKADFPGDARHSASGFAIGTKGYLVCGNVSTASSDYGKEFWEYNETTDTWTKKTDFPGDARHSASGFAIGTKGYLVCGNVSTASSDYGKEFWEYNQVTNAWTKKTDFPGDARHSAAGFNTSTKGYILGGNVSAAGSVFGKEIWEYNQTTDSWTKKTDFNGDTRYCVTGFGIASKGYIVCGKVSSAGSDYGKEFWEWNTIGTGYKEYSVGNSILMYPNPCIYETILESSSGFENATLTVCNLFGKVLKRIQNISGQTFKLQLSNLASGMYTICIVQDSKIISTKNIIVKN